MAIRLAKLARQLKRPAIEVLGLLHAIGYERYRSSNDQVSDAAVARLEKAIRDGVQPVQLEVAKRPSPTRQRQSTSQQGASAPDMMSALMPGVTPLRKATNATPPTSPTRVEAHTVPASAPSDVDPEASPTKPDVEEPPRESSRSDEELIVLSARVASLESENADLRRRLADVQQPRTLKDLLEGRGLRGRDEMERVLQALAEKRLLLEVLGTAHLEDSRPVEQVLTSRVVLVEGDLPSGLPGGLVAVAVGPDRSELGAWSDIKASIAGVSETLMLHGKTYLVVQGGPPIQAHLLRRHLDSRVKWLNSLGEVTEPERTVVVGWGAAPDLADSPSTGELMVVSAVGGLADFARALRLGLESEKER